MTDTINGYLVVREMYTPRASMTRAGRVVLVESDREWITGWQGEGDVGWTWGHYFDSHLDAEIDFLQRCKRGH